MAFILHHGDCLDILAGMDANSIDAIVTDPPYGLSDHKPVDVVKCLTAWMAGEPYVNGGKGFMGKTWDAWVPGPEVWRECYRVLKPGGYLLTFAGSRSYDLMGIALRMAGFRMHPLLGWVFGQGFPKATNLGKMMDRAAKVEREVVGAGAYASRRPRPTADTNIIGAEYGFGAGHTITAPATPEARQWDGWFYGLQSLKPALEPILMAQKPPDRAMTENVLHWGMGAVNVDKCRVGTNGYEDALRVRNNTKTIGGNGKYGGGVAMGTSSSPAGRFPPNLLTDGSDEVRACFPVSEVSGSAKNGKPATGDNYHLSQQVYGYGLGKKQGTLHNDTGSASRFFPALPYDDEDVDTARFMYCAKASKRDRDEGCEGLDHSDKLPSVGRRKCQTCGAWEWRQGQPDLRQCECDTPQWINVESAANHRNHHPTVKPTALMRWLVRLVTPPGGVVLDPFTGSGSTGKAATLEGFDFVGIDLDAEYLEIARRRIEAAKLPLLEAA